jgi:1-acyl-sn-glycerol-3-phosphate acyltransferase
MLRALLSTLFWLFLAVSSVALFPIAVAIWAVTAPFSQRRALLHQFTCFWASLYTWFNPAWSVRIDGRDKIDPAKAYVMVANHQSFLDILILFRLFRHFKWVSKIENFRVPFIGWNMALNGYIKLRRGQRESVEQMFRQCEQALATGSSIMMFPEGTRSPTGHLRAFKTGAFELAKRAQRPILPLVIEGTGNALPKRGFVLQGRHAIRVSVLDEIGADQVAQTPVEALTRSTYAVIAHALGEPTEMPIAPPVPAAAIPSR